jgi:hypothetical protein
LEDVVTVNFLCAGKAKPHMSLAKDDLEGALTLAGCELFGIVNADGKSCATQHDGGGHDRPGPRPPTRLIHSGNESKP